MYKHVIALVLAMLLNATANLLIKFGMKAMPDGFLAQGPWPALGHVIRNYHLIGGLLCFALNVAFYAYALDKIPISVGYPFMVGLGFAIIATVAGVFLGEKLEAIQWIGVATVFFGVILIASRMRGEDSGTPPGFPGSSGVSTQVQAQGE